MHRQTLVWWAVTKTAIVILLLGWCVLHVRRFDGYLGVSVPVWSRAPGLILLSSGALLVLTCAGILSTRGILSPGDRLFPKEFVASGPFRYIRNPMSFGVVAFMVGLGLYEASLSILLFAAALFVALHLVIVYVEEPGLERRFGESYQDYKRSVNRWLPRLQP